MKMRRLSKGRYSTTTCPKSRSGSPAHESRRPITMQNRKVCPTFASSCTQKARQTLRQVVPQAANGREPQLLLLAQRFLRKFVRQRVCARLPSGAAHLVNPEGGRRERQDCRGGRTAPYRHLGMEPPGGRRARVPAGAADGEVVISLAAERGPTARADQLLPALPARAQWGREAAARRGQAEQRREGEGKGRLAWPWHGAEKQLLGAGRRATAAQRHSVRHRDTACALCI